ncbi:uncharacterized protein LOC129572296 [Sitodiplosis mosellana]|uniref:uncharacterized protein LOC129572296 n=1 Tax=Sitodiplosis mosellana TaxID=263140 RepID=UPI002443B329|nr:uncharacterized protein LOC129572296 [Sitodiplosis mosellana]XP_055308223.1 uncharacterized protein LOC129572296 [Sitodiplosis mosellana]XP_055308230.1 uncharacterized protein LOC129572296 [Sitodiplosis mosellana]
MEHENSSSHPKEFEIFECSKIPKKIDDMCDDAIEMILSYLELADLANISDVSKRLQTIAKSIYSRKHAHRLICIDAFQFDLDTVHFSFYCKIKPIIRINDAKVWFKLIRNFGESIKYIYIHSDYHPRSWDERNIPSSYKYVIEYILEYCADSLEVLEFFAYPFLPLNKPLTKLKKFIGQTRDVSFDAIEYMPNLNYLFLSCIPITLERKCFPHMDEFRTTLESRKDVDSFISFLHMNRQIKKLWLAFPSDDSFDLIIPSLNEILPELKTLKIQANYESKRDRIPFSRFKTIDTFSCKGFSPDKFYGSFVFNDFKRLSFSLLLDILDSSDVALMNLTLHMKNLKILKIPSKLFIKNCQILLSELSELELIIIQNSRQHENNVLTQILGSQWKQILMERNELCSRAYSCDIYKLKFQRKK